MPWCQQYENVMPSVIGKADEHRTEAYSTQSIWMQPALNIKYIGHENFGRRK